MARAERANATSKEKRRGKVALGAVPVRECVVVGPRGERRSRVVYCPFDGRSLPLDDCERCAHHGGTSANGRPTSVACGRAVDEVPTAASQKIDRRLPGQMPIAALMQEPICVDQELGIEDLAAMLVERRIGGAPVIDRRGALVGIVTKTDIARHRQDGPGPVERATAGDIMSTVVFTVSENARLCEATEIMAEKGVHRVPVVAASGDVVGVVSTMDVLRWVARRVC